MEFKCQYLWRYCVIKCTCTESETNKNDALVSLSVGVFQATPRLSHLQGHFQWNSEFKATTQGVEVFHDRPHQSWKKPMSGCSDVAATLRNNVKHSSTQVVCVAHSGAYFWFLGAQRLAPRTTARRGFESRAWCKSTNTQTIVANLRCLKVFWARRPGLVNLWFQIKTHLVCICGRLARLCSSWTIAALQMSAAEPESTWAL